MAFDRSQCPDSIFYEDMIDHRSYVHNLRSYAIKAWKTSGLNEIQTHNLCDTATDSALLQRSITQYPALNETLDYCAVSPYVWTLQGTDPCNQFPCVNSAKDLA